MKLNKTKILIPSLAIVAGACLVGSVSGTVAWYQYSTRVTAAYQGASAHCSENLQIRLYRAASDAVGTSGTPGYIPAISEAKSDWKQDLLISDINTFLTAVRGGSNLTPVTSGKLAENKIPSTLYKNPIYQYGTMSNWGVANAVRDYVELPLQFRVLDVDGNTSTETYLAKKIYLSDITLAAKVAGKDITSALRVVVDNGVASGDTSFQQTFSKDGNPVNVGGTLDLNNDGSVDKETGYEWNSSRSDVKYGEYNGDTPETAASQAVGTLATAVTELKVANDADPYDIKGKPLFTSSAATGDSATIEAKNDWASVTIRIYLEGWTELSGANLDARSSGVNATPTTVWDATKLLGDTDIGFNVGLRFTAEAHVAH